MIADIQFIIIKASEGVIVYNTDKEWEGGHSHLRSYKDKPPTQWGFNHPKSNLTKKELDNIRVRLMEGASAKRVARELGMGHRQVLQIAHKNSYSNEPGPKGWDTWQYEGG
ncbi:MAG: hypothetical protein QMD71_06380 [bacterium]|nr:hypothetical protein [bacterium]